MRKTTVAGRGAPSRAPRGITAVLGVVLTSITLLSACASGSTTTSVPSTPNPNTPPPTSANGVIVTVLQNMKANGFNSNRLVNRGLGGLYINWRYGTTPIQANLDSTGVPQPANAPKPDHDFLTDLRYMHNLWLYKSTHPNDTQFDSEIARYTPILKFEFSHPADRRGWIYDELMDVYRLSNDPFYQDAANKLVAYFDSHYYHANTGGIYEITADHPHGFVRVDLSLEQACALIQAGTLTNNAQWVRDGQAALRWIYAHAYIASYHAFPAYIDNAELPGGAPNPDPNIYRGMYGHTKLEGGAVRLGETSLLILALLHTYMVTHDHSYLDKANDLLTPLTIDHNDLGIWDTQNGGYFASIYFPGSSIQHPGTPAIYSNAKESGRQLQMIQVFRVANTLTNNRYQAMQDALVQVAIQKAYYAPGHGYLYEQSSTWQVLTAHDGQPENWDTTEAMGIALEGLLSTERSNPW